MSTGEFVEERCYYVYVLRRPDVIWVDGLPKPFYVGKGKGNRINYHVCHYGENSYKENVIKKIKGLGLKVIHEKVIENLTEKEAFLEEMKLIKFYGRYNNRTGILTNVTDGGNGISGHVHSLETREKISVGHIGIQKSPETCQKLSLAGKGRKLTEACKKKISQAHLGKHLSNDHKQKLSISGMGNKNSLGVKASEETKKELSGIGRNRYLKDLEKMGLSSEIIGVRHVKKEKPVKVKKIVEHKTDRRMSEEAKQHLSDIWRGVPKGHGAEVSKGKTKIQVEIDGVNYSLRELSKLYNMDYSKLSYRYRSGLRGKDIITEGRVKRDLSEYLGRTEHGAFVSKVLITDEE